MFDLQDSKTIGYHLFLLPEGELFNNLQNIINILAEKYDGPKFEPHATLLARIPKIDEVELISKTQKLASMMKSFEINPKEIFAEDAYFRALYCKAEESAELEKYHQYALEIFGVKDVNVYMPHVSLYYGNLPKYKKDEMIKSLVLPINMKFLVDKIYLYKTDGEAQNWRQIGSYKFKN